MFYYYYLLKFCLKMNHCKKHAILVISYRGQFTVTLYDSTYTIDQDSNSNARFLQAKCGNLCRYLSIMSNGGHIYNDQWILRYQIFVLNISEIVDNFISLYYVTFAITGTGLRTMAFISSVAFLNTNLCWSMPLSMCCKYFFYKILKRHSIV